MIRSLILKRCLSSRGRHTYLKIPYMEEQLMHKLKDQHFNQYGLSILKNKTNLFKQLSVLNSAYIINNDIVLKHRSTLLDLRKAHEFFDRENNYRLLSSDLILERLFSMLYISLHYYKEEGHQNHHEVSSLLQFMVNDYHYSVYDEPVPSAIDKENQTSELVNTYYFNLSDPNKIISSSNHQLVSLILYLLDRFFQSNMLTYTHKDLKQWLISLNSNSIKTASHSLNGLSDIPLFIIRDCLLRQPRSVEDLDLLLGLCEGNFDKLFDDGISLGFQNIVHGCISYDTKKLQIFLEKFFENKLQHLDEHEMTIMVNKLMLLISQTNVTSPRNSFFYQDLLRSQSFLLSSLSEKFPTKKTSALLNIEGYIGITSLFQLAGDEKCMGILSIVENEYDKILINLISSKEFTRFTNLTSLQKKYYADLDLMSLQADVFNLRLLLATSEQALIGQFDRIVQLNAKNEILVNYPQLWTSFVVSLKKLGIMTSAMSRKLWTFYMKLVLDKFDDLKHFKIDGKFIAELIDSNDDIKHIMFMLKRLQLKKYKLNNMILRKLLSKLYSKIGMLETRDLKTYADTLSYTRSLYKNLSQRTTTVVSTMLLGESRISPEIVYDLYLEELQGLRKDENSIRALCLACICHYQNNNNELMWFYENKEWKPSYEVCILEFNKNVLQNEKSPSFKIFPTTKLWEIYIQVLGIYGYRNELINILSLWDDLNYKPSENLLLQVLVNLDNNDAIRILRHGKILNYDNPKTVKSELEIRNKASTTKSGGWPWPGEQVYVNYRYEDEQEKSKLANEKLNV